MLQFGQMSSGSKRIVIMGCDRLGATVATALSEQGHAVHILDPDPDSFDRLPPGMIDEGRIVPLVGDGTRQQDLLNCSIQDANIFLALAESDTQNALAAQIVKQVFHVPAVICRVDDPSKERVYNELGIVAISAVNLVTEKVLQTTAML